MFQKILAGVTATIGLCIIAATCLVFYYIWPEKDSTMPAWIQAIGSVLAIFVALGVTWYQQAEHRAGKDDEAKNRRAGQIVAAHLFAQEALAIAKTIEESLTDRGIYEETLIYCLDHLIDMTRTSAIPTWEMHRLDARDLMVTTTVIRALVGGIAASRRQHAITAARDMIPPHLQYTAFIEVPLISDKLAYWIQELERVGEHLDDRYLEITGEEMIADWIHGDPR